MTNNTIYIFSFFFLFESQFELRKTFDTKYPPKISIKNLDDYSLNFTNFDAVHVGAIRPHCWLESLHI